VALIEGGVGMTGAVGADVAGVVGAKVVGVAGVVGAWVERSGAITASATAGLSHETPFTRHRSTKMFFVP